MATITFPPLTAPRVEHALWWASRGWKVFPVCSPEEGPHNHHGKPCDPDKDLGKLPRTDHGKDDGTCDPAQIRAWWQRNPNANIGGRPPKDHFVIDIDGPCDVEFPPTWEHSTGKGRHLTYRQNITKPVDQTSKTLWDNVDTRTSDKGYVVLPPSVHASGRVYTLVSETPPMVFPAELVPARRRGKSATSTDGSTDIVKLLTMPRDAAELGDDAMVRVAGYLARYIPDREAYRALLDVVNGSLSDPLDEQAMLKKMGVFDKHRNNVEEQTAKALDDEARGWLFELAGSGYHTEVGSGDKIDYVEFSDFRVVAKGLVVKPDNHVLIVDFHRADGTVLENVHIDAATLTNNAKLREFCARRGMAVYTNRGDKRSDYGMRLFKFLMSQEPAHLASTDYYGWNPDSQTFITDQGEITLAGERQEYSKVFPEQNLTRGESKPVHYGFDFSEADVRDYLARTLALNEPLEMAKLGAWLVMTCLKGQWAEANLPGVVTSAFSETGKSSLYEIITAWLGYRQRGGKITAAVFRDMLAKSFNSAVWLDDFELSDDHRATMRAALTVGSETKMIPAGGGFVDKTYHLRGSVIVTDEGNGLLHEKANADRFLKVELTTGHRSVDVERLKSLDMSNGAGTLVGLVFKHRHHLDALPDMLSQAHNRSARWRALLVVGARILSDMLDDPRWSVLVTDWADALNDERNQASLLIHNIIPTVWMGCSMPTNTNKRQEPLFYNRVTNTFWVNVRLTSEAWTRRFGLSKREQQLGTPEAIKAELAACGSTGDGAARGIGKLRYKELPAQYSAIAYGICDVDHEAEVDED